MTNDKFPMTPNNPTDLTGQANQFQNPNDKRRIN